MIKNTCLAYRTDKGKRYTIGKEDNVKLSVAFPEQAYQVRKIHRSVDIASTKQNNRDQLFQDGR